MKLVLDASAVAKLLFPEEGSELVEEAVLRAEEVYVPTLARYEVGNVVWKRFARGEISEGEAKEAWAVAKELFVSWKERDADCLEVSLKCGVSCYDASYASLTLEVGAKLLTFDEKLKRSLEVCSLKHVLM